MAKSKKAKAFNPKPRLMKGGRQVMSAIEKIQRLQEQMAEVKAQAIEELKEKRKTAAQALADIDQEIASLTGSKAAKSGITRQRDPNKPCPVCGEKGHDARRHRGESRKKK